LKTRKERCLEVDSILLLLIQAFSLGGPDQADQPAAQEEAINLQAILSQALIEDGTIKDPNLRKFLYILISVYLEQVLLIKYIVGLYYKHVRW
jgi:hypothetical protein